MRERVGESVLSHVEMRGTSVIAAIRCDGNIEIFLGATHFVQIYNELIFFALSHLMPEIFISSHYENFR